MQFSDLPESVVDRIITYLPQQEKINLALTNFSYYHPCTKHLYNRLMIQLNPTLHPCCNFTMINGFSYQKSGKFYTESSQLSLVNARLSVLNRSIEINPQLLENLSEIFIFLSSFNDELVANLQNLVDNLIRFKKESVLSKFYVNSLALRSRLDYSRLNCASVVVDDVGHVTPHLSELIIGSNFEFDKIPSAIFQNLDSLILPTNEIYWNFVDRIIGNGYRLGLSTFRLVLDEKNFEKNVSLINLIQWDKLQNLEIHVGTSGDNQEVCSDLMNLIPTEKLKNLKKIAFVQSRKYELHTVNEQFDYIVFEFINSVVDTNPIKYVSISHNLPNYGNFNDGFEGNYLRRKQMYSTLLPKILSKAKNENIQLYLPNFFQTLSCYEQPMNTMMWNGCKCDHCNVYLQHLDEYMMHHRYYNEKYRGYKDLNCSIMFFTVGNAVRGRYIEDSLITHLQFDKIPRQDNLYDFHNTMSQIPFKCYQESLVEQGEFDEPEPVQAVEVHHENKRKCKYNERLFYHNYNKVICHYLDNFISDMVNLSRGDAEEEEIGIYMNDGGDADYTFTIKKISINSVDYSIDKEVNGTHCFRSTDH